MSADHTLPPIAEAFLPKRENELGVYPSMKKKHCDQQAMDKMRESLIFAHTEIDQLRKQLLELLPLEERMKQKEWWAETTVQPVPMVTQAAYDDLMTEFQDMRASRDGYKKELAANDRLVADHLLAALELEEMRYPSSQAAMYELRTFAEKLGYDESVESLGSFIGSYRRAAIAKAKGS